MLVEIEYPMAFVILGGLVSSTVLNLFVLPVVYSHVPAAATVVDRDAT